MKFIAPEVEVLKFNVADVLTTSLTTGGEAPTEGGADADSAAFETLVSVFGMPCTGTGADMTYADCL